jgi:hypothetical protein
MVLFDPATTGLDRDSKALTEHLDVTWSRDVT